MAPLPPLETMAVALTMAPLFADTFPNDANGRGNILWTEECFTRQFRAEWDYSGHEVCGYRLPAQEFNHSEVVTTFCNICRTPLQIQWREGGRRAFCWHLSKRRREEKEEENGVLFVAAEERRPLEFQAMKERALLLLLLLLSIPRKV